MSISEFDNGYWYATEIKQFAQQIGIKSTTKLRKDELEVLIKQFLKSGEVIQASRNTMKIAQLKDSDAGLQLNQQIINYTNNKETKDFIESESLKLDPDFKRKSGSRYRLNRWREQEIAKGRLITYADLVTEYIRLNQHQGAYPQEAAGRYINFLANYLADRPESSRESAIQAWKELKGLDIPKTYDAWKARRDKKRG